MRYLGLAGVVLSLLLALGFVAATMRADARLAEEGRVSGFVGWPRRLALAAVLVAVASLLLLAGAVFGTDPAR